MQQQHQTITAAAASTTLPLTETEVDMARKVTEIEKNGTTMIGVNTVVTAAELKGIPGTDWKGIIEICKEIRDSFGKTVTGKTESSNTINICASKSFAISRVMAPTGYMVTAKPTALFPASHIKDSLFSWFAASEFIAPRELSAEELTPFLNAEFGKQAMASLVTEDGDTTLRSEAIANGTSPQTAGRDLLPWTETIGSNGFVGYFKLAPTTDMKDSARGEGPDRQQATHTKWMACVFVSETSAMRTMAAEMRSDEKYSDKPLVDVLAMREVAAMENAMRRSARRILARMLAHVDAVDVTYLPDTESATPSLQTKGDDGLSRRFGIGNANEMVYKLYTMRNPPYYVVPQIEQEMDAFVVNYTSGTTYDARTVTNLHYFCGVVPTTRTNGGAAISIGKGGSVIVYNPATIKTLSFVDCWMHPGVNSGSYGLVNGQVQVPEMSGRIYDPVTVLVGSDS